MAASQSVVPYKEKPPVKVQINEIVPPVDYSFLHITSVDECESEEPRETSPRKIQPAKTHIKDEEGKFKSMCLRLNNNELKDVNNLMNIAVSLFQHPSNIGWIDLSFNCLANIDPVLTQFEHLKILYLHGNAITDLKEVNKLASLPKLWKLTLHGNEMENIKGYRLYVLSALPHLTNFDFSRVTKADRVTANTWRSFNNPDRQKKIKREED